MRIKAFKALRPTDNKIAGKLAAVPYDTVDTEEARKLAEGNPLSFLRVSRPELEFPVGYDPYSDAIYQRGKENLAKLTKSGALVDDPEPSCYVYRQIMDKHVQHSVVACCHADDYKNNVILKHEKTRKDKEDDRTRHLLETGAQTGLVFLAYKDKPAIDKIVAEIAATKPLYDFTSVDGIQHTVWRDFGKNAALIKEFGTLPVCYIADGHHRAAAAARAAEERRKGSASSAADLESDWFQASLFPAGQLKILPYHRLVKDLHGLDVAAFLCKVRENFSVTENAKPDPGSPRRVSMYLGGHWYGLSWEQGKVKDPVSLLDVSRLQDKLLAPILGIADPRTDKRIEFVGGIRGSAELVRAVDSGRAKVAFSMYPVTVEEVMSIADAGMIMPPKSTWFEPKLRSGLLVHRI